MALKRNGWIIASLTAFFGLPLACKERPPAYTPGLGEFMSGIQVHHEKLWFAGKAGNWQLADFETGEIRETIDDIQKY